MSQSPSLIDPEVGPAGGMRIVPWVALRPVIPSSVRVPWGRWGRPTPFSVELVAICAAVSADLPVAAVTRRPTTAVAPGPSSLLPPSLMHENTVVANVREVGGREDSLLSMWDAERWLASVGVSVSRINASVSGPAIWLWQLEGPLPLPPAAPTPETGHLRC